MFYLSFLRAIFRHTASDSGRPRGFAEMSAKCLHLQEVMRQRNTGNYITQSCFSGDSNARTMKIEIPAGDHRIAKIFQIHNASRRSGIIRKNFYWRSAALRAACGARKEPFLSLPLPGTYASARATRPRKHAGLFSGCPIFCFELFDPRKCAIIGHQNGPDGQSMGGDHQVQIAHRQAHSLQIGAQGTIVASSI